MRRSLSLILFLLTAFALTSAASSSAAQGTGTFDPVAVDFGSVRAGDLPTSMPVTLTNSSSDTPITIDQNDVTFGDPNPNAFGTSNDNCAGTTLQPGASCGLKVTFDPNSAGSYSSTMSLSES